jgi:hypothetical protein
MSLLRRCLPLVFALHAPMLDARDAAKWLDAAAIEAARFGTVRFQARDGNRLTAYVYRATAFDSVRGPIWFIMHGAGRGAEGYLQAAAPVAERHAALAIAIEFSRDTYRMQEDYTLNVGGYAEVERVFEAVRRLLGGRQQGYYLFGHSAGAQFVHRLITFVPEARVLGAVAANAGWYTLPVTHFDMPYGLRGSERIDVRRLFARPLTVLLGARDTATPDADRLLRGTRAAMAQGPTRLARGEHYFATARRAAATIGEPLKWRLAVVPRAAHEVTQVIASAGFFLFENGESACEPTTAAAAAPQLVINEILADPPKDRAGDANADGVRDASDDEFVELVNTGTAPVCLAGWTLGDANEAERHVFPLGAALPPGRALVVFGGGVPTGRFGGATVQWAAFGGRLNLSNAGDVLTLRDAGGAVAKQLSWGDCAGARCASEHRAGGLGFEGSLVRWPELTGTWRAHAEVARSRFSPGVRADGTAFR